jgi:hypothetical protein
MAAWLAGEWPWYMAGLLIGLFVPALLITGNKELGHRSGQGGVFPHVPDHRLRGCASACFGSADQAGKVKVHLGREYFNPLQAVWQRRSASGRYWSISAQCSGGHPAGSPRSETQ